MQKVIFVLLTLVITLSLTLTIPEKRQTNNDLDESVKETFNKIFSTKTDSPHFNDLLDSFGGPNPETDHSKLENEKQKESDNKNVDRPKDQTNSETSNPQIENEQQEEPQASEETVEEEENNPKTGFYFLIDWNTFLEVDDQLGRRVNLRIQPKVGDPKRFFSVTVP